MFLWQPVCKKFFIVVYATGSKSLKNIMKHMTDNGPVPRAHGNSGKPICFFVDVLKPLVFAGSVNKWLLSRLPCDLTVAMQQ